MCAISRAVSVAVIPTRSPEDCVRYPDGDVGTSPTMIQKSMALRRPRSRDIDHGFLGISPTLLQDGEPVIGITATDRIVPL